MTTKAKLRIDPNLPSETGALPPLTEGTRYVWAEAPEGLAERVLADLRAHYARQGNLDAVAHCDQLTPILSTLPAALMARTPTEQALQYEQVVRWGFILRIVVQAERGRDMPPRAKQAIEWMLSAVAGLLPCEEAPYQLDHEPTIEALATNVQIVRGVMQEINAGLAPCACPACRLVRLVEGESEPELPN